MRTLIDTPLFNLFASYLNGMKTAAANLAPAYENFAILLAELPQDEDRIRNELLYTMAKVKAFFSSTYFKVVVVLCIIAAVVYAVLWVYVMLLTVRRVEQPTPKRKNKPNDWNKE